LSTASAISITHRPRFSRLADWLTWQESLHGAEIELGLERCRAVYERMGLGKPPPYIVVSVAGTNGKGSSVALLDAILSAAGYRVGRYTSPHLVQYNERIQIAGFPAGDEAICAAFDHIDHHRGDISLTYFEFGTLAALDIFSRAAIDIALLEVGLGGRLDAVNILDADVALAATIDIDHVEWLGPDRESIGREKAGIFRAGRPAICSDPQPPASLVQYADQIGARLALLDRDYGWEKTARGWTWWSRDQRLPDLPPPRLHGEFQFQNAAGVLMALEILRDRCPVSRTAVDQGLCRVSLSGRFQVFPGPVTWILDVAHNPQSVRVLAETLRSQPCAGRTHFLLGMLRDKDIRGVFQIMSGLASHWHLTTLPGRRGTTSEFLYEQWLAAGGGAAVSLYTDVEAAYTWIQQLAVAGDRVLVFGSFLTVAGVAKLIE
jgi:dihydrofolate synthase/folylpolyglutamate synthase